MKGFHFQAFRCNETLTKVSQFILHETYTIGTMKTHLIIYKIILNQFTFFIDRLQTLNILMAFIFLFYFLKNNQSIFNLDNFIDIQKSISLNITAMVK